MDCACVAVYIDNCYDDGGQKIRVAGTEHQCCECWRQIELGEEYEDAFGANIDYDDKVERFDTYSTCIDCVSMRDSFFCGEWIYENIWEDLGEHLDNIVKADGSGISSDCITPLTPRARDKVCDLIEEVWEEMDE